jgi:hypothetical protein
VLPPHNPAIEGLEILQDYYYNICTTEPGFYIISEQAIYRHISDMHQLKPQYAKYAGKYIIYFF